MNENLINTVIGFISGFDEGKGRTGYQVKALVRGFEHIFDAEKTVYDLKDTDKYFPYPCLGEILFLFKFNDDGILIDAEDVNDLTRPDNPVKTGLSMGTMRMFQKQLTPETPPFGEILEFEGNRVRFKKFNEYRPSGPACGEVMADTICALTYSGNMPVPGDGVSFKLAPDCVIYVWDWGTALHPFCKCSREQAKEWNFVEHFSNGSIEDIKRAYWVGFFSTRGNEDEIDVIKCFPNKVPGWVE